MSFFIDYQYGKNQELNLFDKINTYFNDNLIKSVNKYEKYDFKGDLYIYELKSRNCLLNTFDTTIIPYSKLIKNKEDKQIFIFNFQDGLYYIKYNKTQFSKYDLNYFKRRERVDFNDINQLYYFIPVIDLIKI